MVQRSDLVLEIIDLVVSSLNLHFLDKSSITADTTLMAGGIGLDSVDILEIVVAVEQRYGVKIQNAQQGQEVFKNIGTIADFVLASKGAVSVPVAPPAEASL
jgi:acyl carrier protein